MKWTADQQKAIAGRHKNILVSAAAGSGKTALLIERITRMVVEEGIDVSALLVLTFTRAAAAEMKDRLRSALNEALSAAGTKDKKNLQRQVAALDDADIATIHGFCTKLVRNYFQEVGLDPAFMMADDATQAIYSQEAMNEVCEEWYGKILDGEDPGAKQLFDMFGDNGDDRALKDYVISTYHFLITQPDSKEWCREALENFDIDLSVGEENFWESTWGEAFKDQLDNDLHEISALYEKAIGLSLEMSEFSKITTFLEDEYALIKDLREKKGEDITCIYGINNAEFKRFTFPKNYDPEYKELIVGLRNMAKERVKEMQQLLGENLDVQLLRLREMKNPMEALLRLTDEYSQRYHNKKQEKNLLDFNDLEQYTLDILNNKAIAEGLRQKYEYVFLDEYQDTNAMQEAIVSHIVREDNYFMVGDVKQSIYRFRLADPTIFLEKYHRFAKKGENSTDELITLGQNFRSSGVILEGVNAIFERIMSEKLGEIEYDDRAKLYTGQEKRDDEAPIGLDIITVPGRGSTAEEDADSIQLEKSQLEARAIGKKIQQRIGKPFWDTKKRELRKLDYGDIGIFMRTLSGRGEVFAKELADMGIPVYVDGNGNYYESIDIEILLNLLKLIDNQHQDIPLLSVMTSPIGGFSVEAIAAIREMYPEGYFYRAVACYRVEQDDPLSQQLRNFHNQLEEWRRLSMRMDIEDFIWQLYLDTGYYDFVAALPGGEQRQNNLRLLIKRAGDYKRSTLKGLFYFIRYIERMKKSKGDSDTPSILSEKANVVRLMSIHKSKGLEFPVVFVAGLGTQFNRRDQQKRILFHKTMGICPEYINLESRARMTSLAQALCINRVENETLSEEMRLLYVAMTRARNELLLSGVVKTNDLEINLKKWKDKITPLRLKKSPGFLDWIMMALCSDKNFTEIPEITGNFSICCQKSSDILTAFEPQKQAANRDRPLVPEGVRKEVHRRLSYSYPFAERVVLPGKMSVTEAVRRQDGESIRQELPEIVEKPAFLAETAPEISAAEQGTALHRLIEDLPLGEIAAITGDEKALYTYLEKRRQHLVDREVLMPEAARTINLQTVAGFLTSSTGQRMLKADVVHRELPFTYRISPKDVDASWENTEEALTLQGMIDCIFMENGQYVLLDYKTDRLYSVAERKNRIGKYTKQINFYTRAFEAIMGKPVAERILCLLSMDEYIVL